MGPPVTDLLRPSVHGNAAANIEALGGITALAKTAKVAVYAHVGRDDDGNENGRNGAIVVDHVLTSITFVPTMPCDRGETMHPAEAFPFLEIMAQALYVHGKPYSLEI